MLGGNFFFFFFLAYEEEGWFGLAWLNRDLLDLSWKKKVYGHLKPGQVT